MSDATKCPKCGEGNISFSRDGRGDVACCYGTGYPGHANGTECGFEAHMLQSGGKWMDSEQSTPVLLTEIRRLAAENERLKDALENMWHQIVKKDLAKKK